MAIRPLLLLTIASALILWGGCVNQKQNNDGCTERIQGLEVSFYSRSRCQTEARYPEAVESILLCIFDGDGILAYYRYLEDVILDESYSVTLDTDPGLYTVVSWAGIDRECFETAAPEEGTTTKEDILLSVIRADGTASDLVGAEVYFGQSNAVYVQAGVAGGEADYRDVSVNLLEVTNRLEISVDGLPTRAEDYEITIESDDGSMTFDGEIAPDEPLIYRAAMSYGDGYVEGVFTLLKLETGHSYYIAVRNIVSGTELYYGSLLGALLLKNPEVDLLCDHDFTIRFTAEDKCDCGTYAITEIWVNNWLVHSYETDL
ncbi:MAG: FimB/Mfa2 family fimbrial subunit [Rikenellaceae bacterium]|nr:FimB/Mfa2 family fimbrial subunit [Rikenellaceae bacterium]